MKVPLAIGILPVTCAQFFPTSFHVIKRAESEQDKQQFRRDSNLESIAAKKCDMAPGPDYLVILVPASMTEDSMTKAMEEAKQMSEEQLVKAATESLSDMFGLFTPTQNKIGCSEATCKEGKAVSDWAEVPLAIGILLVTCAQCFPTSSHVIKRAEPELNQHQFMNNLNGLRKKLADEFKVANMQELRWDSNLESIAAKTCETTPGPDYLVLLAPISMTEDSIKKEIEMVQRMPKEQLVKEATDSVNGLFGLFTPTQNKIGCAEATCKQGKAGVCLTGPRNTITEADFIDGEPGSKCDNGKTSSGLCSNTPKSASVDEGSQPSSVDEKSQPSSVDEGSQLSKASQLSLSLFFFILIVFYLSA
ncbi:hypothetical protein CAEBREN_06034 [Caenorhabditis brenneri]|uniref:Uncharacterized protein n=1 Tax=Caenorhabditis brenneri TaxID=135651 RepID=G0MR87_CAEBE|nr:hypothetical protein CAEBREN_06034 [Caenorhabditis brenneri]